MTELDSAVREICQMLLAIGMRDRADEVSDAYAAIPSEGPLRLNRLSATRMGSLSDLVLFPGDPDSANRFRSLLSTVHLLTKDV